MISFDIETEVKISVEELYEFRVFLEVGNDTVCDNNDLFLYRKVRVGVLMPSGSFCDARAVYDI